MRRLALLLAAAAPVLAACATTPEEKSRFAKPNELMATEIRNRIDQIPYQHREELFQNLLWLTRAGEQAIPDLLTALHHSEPKVRSNAAWVLGQIGDRRVISDLQPLCRDTSDTVRLEVSRTLLLLGDVQHAPALIEALDSDQVQVRYLCHEALKSATGQDFGYDHLSDDLAERHRAVLGWRGWWSKLSGDVQFAQAYAARHAVGADQPASPLPPAPAVEIAPPGTGAEAPAGATSPAPAATPPAGAATVEFDLSQPPAQTRTPQRSR